MRNKKRWFAAMLAAAMLLADTSSSSLGALTVFAEEVTTCECTVEIEGNTYKYTSLASAVEAAPAEGTVVVTKAGNSAETVTVAKKLTIDATKVSNDKITVNAGDGYCVNKKTTGLYKVDAHAWTNHVFTWTKKSGSTLDFDAKITLTCDNGDSKTADALVDSEEKTPVSDKTNGEKVWTATYSEGGSYTDTHTEIIPAGHEYTFTVDWANDGKGNIATLPSGTPIAKATAECKHEDHEGSKTGTATAKVTEATSKADLDAAKEQDAGLVPVKPGCETLETKIYKVEMSFDGKSDTKYLSYEVPNSYAHDDEYTLVPDKVEYKAASTEETPETTNLAKAAITSDGSITYRVEYKCSNEDCAVETVKKSEWKTLAATNAKTENAKKACQGKEYEYTLDIVYATGANSNATKNFLDEAKKTVAATAYHVCDKTKAYDETPATCSEEGKFTGRCSVCGDDVTDAPIAKVTHIFGAADTVPENAAAVDAGKAGQQLVSASKTEAVIAPNCTSKGATYKYCTTEKKWVAVKGTETNATGHTFKLADATKAADVKWAADGKSVIVKRTCDCGTDEYSRYLLATATGSQKDGDTTPSVAFGEGTVTVTNYYGAITKTTKTGDCTAKLVDVFKVNNLTDKNNKAVEKEVTSESYGKHTYAVTGVAFSEDGKKATVTVQCTKDKCANAATQTEVVLADIKAVDNADGTTTYTASAKNPETDEVLDLSKFAYTKTTYDLTKAEIVVNNGKPINSNAFNADVANNLNKIPVSVKINGAEIAVGTGKADVATFAVATVNAGETKDVNVTISANGSSELAVKAVGTKSVSAKFKAFSTLANVKTLVDGKDGASYNKVYDAKAHTFAVTTDTKGANIKYAIVEDGATVKEADYTLDSVSIKDAGEYDVYYMISKADFETKTGKFDVEIDKAPLNVTVGDASVDHYTKVYGDKDPEDLKVSVSGLKGDDTVTSEIAKHSENAGTYKVGATVTGDAVKNYNVVTKTATLVIEKRNATVIVSTVKMTYGDSVDLSNAYKVSGLVEGDKLAVNIDVPDSIETLNVGTYKLTATANNANYEIKTVDGSLIIEKANQVVTVSGTSKSYSAKSLKKAAKSFVIKVDGVNTSFVVTKVSGSKNIKISKAGKVTVKKGTKKGTYSIKVKVAVKSSNNYNAKTVTKTIKVKVK